jgi:pilus assembly protein Flp/PilA
MKETLHMLIKLLAMKNAYLKDEDGATAIEYALIAAGISLVIVGAVFAFGEQLNTLWGTLAGALDGDTSN